MDASVFYIRFMQGQDMQGQLCAPVCTCLNDGEQAQQHAQAAVLELY